MYRISIHSSLKIEYKRTDAGTSGISVTMLYEAKEWKMAVLRKEPKTGLKATDYTEILNLSGRGALRGIRWTDPDNASQNETLKITLDGDVILDSTRDVPNTCEYLNLLKAIAGETLENSVTTDETVITEQRVPFHSTCVIEYKRAGAGSTGLSITMLYELKTY